jgi:hypothetical protein
MYIYRSFRRLSYLLRNRTLDTGVASPLQESRALDQRTPVAVLETASGCSSPAPTVFFGVAMGAGETRQRAELILCLARRKNRNGIEGERKKCAQVEVVGESHSSDFSRGGKIQ